MRQNAMTEKFEMVTVFDKPMLFSCLRIDPKTVPSGMYFYEVRHDDDGEGIPVQIKKFILVNHWGTLISSYPIHLLPNSAYIVGPLAASLVRFYKDYDYYGYADSLEVGESEEDAIHKMQKDLMDNSSIPLIEKALNEIKDDEEDRDIIREIDALLCRLASYTALRAEENTASENTKSSRDITPDDWNYEGYVLTIEEYLKENPVGSYPEI